MNKRQSVKAKMDYAFVDDILWARPLEREYAYSDQMEEFVFDFSQSGEIVGFELFDASQVIGVPKEWLRHINHFRIDIEVGPRHVRIDFKLRVFARNRENHSRLSVERIRPDFLEGTGSTAMASA